MADCVILVGLPASGKSTFYGQRFSATHRHISKDLWPNAPKKGAPADRAAIIGLAREHGARVIGYYFTASTREAMGRNRGREATQRVPDVAIFTSAKRMVPPTAAEGFDELYAVAIGGDGRFDIRGMMEP